MKEQTKQKKNCKGSKKFGKLERKNLNTEKKSECLLKIFLTSGEKMGCWKKNLKKSEIRNNAKYLLLKKMKC